MPTHDSEPLTLLVGPTAAGKSELALELAEAAGAEILSLDSMQVYRGLDVGTAKPGPEDQARVPHHLIDLVDPPERYHVQRYLEDATAARETVRARGRRALFVGGTGFYLKALTHGLFAGAPHDEDLRRELNRRAAEEGSGVLHRELEAVDPAAAARIHPNDAKRVVRGLEVYRSGAGRLSELQREWAVGGGRARRLVGVAPAPDRLEARIRERTEVMLEGGWIDEVRAILEGPGFGPTSGQALGYPEIVAYLERGAPPAERADLASTIALRTRRFARRQRTWFRGFPEIHWIDPETKRAPEEALQALGWG